jgi:tetratricopeptide (TPR) repeat protein
MTYKEDQQVRERRLLSKQAIALAMQGKWEEAVAANKKIIETFPHDLEAFNRLGRAYMELGEYTLATESYGQAMQLDPANTIASKNLKRLLHIGEGGQDPRLESRYAAPQHFIEEIGKAGVVDLQNLSPRGIRARLVAGDEVSLRVDGTRLVAENSRGEYLGQVEPKTAQRLIRLMEGGNRYSAAVITSWETKLTIIIREIYQDLSQVGRLSFPPRGAEKIQPYVSGRVLRREMEEDDDLLVDTSDDYNDMDDEE